jgi:hypothetical protein
MTVRSKDPARTNRSRFSSAQFCATCGAEPHPGDRFCRDCGARKRGRADEANRQSFPFARPPAAQMPEGAKRLKRPVSSGALLVALLMTAVLFAGIATAMVLTDTGPRGREGPQGQSGLVGSKGERGARGRTGKKGAAGFNGAAGAAGTPGAQGRPGDKVACSNDANVPLPYC